MDLIEIVKGMPNASEAINENFKKLGADIGKNENGYYAKFKSGFLVCWGTITVEDNKVISLPSAFKDTESAVFAANPTTRNPNENRSTQVSGAISQEGAGLYLRLYKQQSSVSELEIMYVAVGLAKEE